MKALGSSVFALVIVAALGACDSEEPEVPAPATGEPETPAAAEAPSEPAVPAEPEGDPIELLHAVQTSVAVSTAYRDRETQVARLFDGDMETAWNSKSEDLVGAWIEVRVPEGARVTALRLTAGYTKPGGDTDLFTGNHRVAKIRVLHGGEEVAIHELDTDSRELQSVPVEGGGGVWRIEVAEIVPGSKESWKEICISELEVLGRAEGATPGERFPRFAIGALPGPPEPVDREAYLGQLRLNTHQLATAWLDHEEQMLVAFYLNGPGWSEGEQDEFRDVRRQVLRRALALVEPVHPAGGDALRRALVTSVEPSWQTYQRDLDTVAAAMEGVGEWADDDAERCRWAQAHARLRLQRVDMVLGAAEEEGDGDELDLAVELDGHHEGYGSDPRTHTRNLLRMSAEPPFPALATEWGAMRAQLERAAATCGWGG